MHHVLLLPILSASFLVFSFLSSRVSQKHLPHLHFSQKHCEKHFSLARDKGSGRGKENHTTPLLTLTCFVMVYVPVT